MQFLHVRCVATIGKELALCFLTVIALSPAARCATSSTRVLEFLLDQPPASTNPRATLDATGQRLNNLLYSSLTRIAPDLEPKPEIAESWEIRNSGREVRFRMRPGLRDHEGKPITAQSMAMCLEQYRIGKPVSPYTSSFPQWRGTRHTDQEVILDLAGPDPYLLRNLSLLHYFRTASSPIPCSEPKGSEAVIGSGPYRMERWDPLPDTDLAMVPVDHRYMPVRFHFVADDNTRMLEMLRGKIDVTLDSIGLAKERWLEANHGDRFRLLQRISTRVSYLAMNTRNPILSHAEVRRAIALAIDRDSIIRYKMFGLASVAGSLLAPEIPGALETPFAYDPAHSEKLLDQAGFPRRLDGVRFTIHYKTTPVREGFETALMLREMLAHVGIRLELEVVEPAVFLQSVRKGNFEMYSSRWLGISDGSILYRTLDSKSPDNRVGYTNPRMDALLERAEAELNPDKRIAVLHQIQQIMAEDLPYFPLWFWHAGLTLRRDQPALSKLNAEDLSATGALEPILLLR